MIKARLSGRWPLQHIISTVVGRLFSTPGPALLPLADDRKVAMVWSLDDSAHPAIAELNDEAFLRALNRALGPEAPTACQVGPRASFPLRQCHAVDYVEQGLVLVADAAHSIHPLAGQGINLVCQTSGYCPSSSSLGRPAAWLSPLLHC